MTGRYIIPRMMHGRPVVEECDIPGGSIVIEKISVCSYLCRFKDTCKRERPDLYAKYSSNEHGMCPIYGSAGDAP